MEKRLGKSKRKRVVLTGGHAASSAFVVSEEIRHKNKPWDIYWIGFKSALEGKNIATLSSIYFPKYGIKTYNITAGRIQRKWTRHTLTSLLKIPIGFVHAYSILRKIKPDVILSFGGFSAYPVVVVGYLLGVPIIIHEQTSVVGRANRYSAPFARKIAISRETSLPYFPKDKVVLTGNPIPKDIVKDKGTLIGKKPTLFITGGQSGSTTINNVVEKALPPLLKKYKVIHQTGLKDEGRFVNLKKKLHSSIKKDYMVFGIMDPKKYDDIFNNASVLISRSGANVVSKIVAAQKPAVLVPLPISYLKEQDKNALYAKKHAGSRIIEQDALVPEKLLGELDSLVMNWKKVSRVLSNEKNPDVAASGCIVSIIEELL